jgi:twitching motility two-component system response regulator PilG
LKKAVERYLKVIAKEENVHAHFYLGMAHLNLEHWEETLNCLHRTVKLAPEKHFYSNQLQILLNHMASLEAGNRQEVSADLQHAARAASPETGVKKNKILVVEDSPTTRKVITITLKQHGYSTMEATDGLEAFSRLNEQRPDLILLDLILPKMDGYKILSIIKSNPEFKDIPVIMLTSKDGFLDKMKGKMAGSAAYLTKPFEPKRLMETIERIL